MSAPHATTDLYDRLKDEARYLLPGLRDFGGKTRFSGVVTTVRCFEDNSRLKELATTDGRGRVVVVDGGGSLRCALLGDLIAGELAKNGWEGVVVHGCVRDVGALAAVPLGVKALAANPRASTRRGEGQRDLPVTVLGATVRPGDVLFADEDGVVVLSTEQAAGL